MTLALGTKLGRYEIRSKIGEGGMGASGGGYTPPSSHTKFDLKNLLGNRFP